MGLLRSWFGYLLSPLGLAVLAAFDSSLIFFLPFGVDAAAIALAARDPDRAWLYPLCATAGSLVGAAITFYIGRTIGDQGLSRFVGSRRLARLRTRARGPLALSTAFLSLVPPPFPFTALILVSGAMGASARRLFAVLAVARLLRFGAEALAARRFGQAITLWLRSPTVERAVIGFVLLLVAGTVWSAIAFLRSTRRRREP